MPFNWGALSTDVTEDALPSPRRKATTARRLRAPWIVLIACLAWPWLAAPALADPIDLTFRLADHPDTWIKPSLRMDTVFFGTSGAYGGDTKQNLGNNAGNYMEFGVVPALDGQMSLGEYGTLRSRVSVVWTTTQIQSDPAGSALNEYGRTNNPSQLTLEDAYIGWSSGDLFADSLGKDAIDLSFGSQKYVVGPNEDTDGLGSGFIFYNAGSDGSSRGGFWLGLRNSFRYAGIARLKTGAFRGEAVFLRSDELGNINTTGAGVNASYDFAGLLTENVDFLDLERLRLGFGYWNFWDSDDRRRDGLDVINARLSLKPLKSLPGLELSSEVVYENNGTQNKSFATWAGLGYEFQDVSWKPYISYRYSYFQGDDGNGSNNNFDPLFYGFNDWNYWYLGEISGEWLTQNTNLQVHVFRFRTQPLDSVTAQLFYIYQRADNLDNGGLTPRPPLSTRSAQIDSKNLSQELDFIVDWSVNDYLSVSAVAAYLFPMSGAKDFFGGANDTWQQYMLYASLQF